jgi:hypothetical protein
MSSPLASGGSLLADAWLLSPEQGLQGGQGHTSLAVRVWRKEEEHPVGEKPGVQAMGSTVGC